MTRAEVWGKVNEDKFFDMLVYLKSRWEDERDYEDIKEYIIPIQKSIPSAFQMNKRPFGFKCNALDGGFHVFLKRDGNYIKLCGKNI